MITGRIYTQKVKRNGGGGYISYVVHAYVKRRIVEQLGSSEMVLIPMPLFNKMVETVDKLNRMVREENIDRRELIMTVKELYQLFNTVIEL